MVDWNASKSSNSWITTETFHNVRNIVDIGSSNSCHDIFYHDLDQDRIIKKLSVICILMHRQSPISELTPQPTTSISYVSYPSTISTACWDFSSSWILTLKTWAHTGQSGMYSIVAWFWYIFRSQKFFFFNLLTPHHKTVKHTITGWALLTMHRLAS